MPHLRPATRVEVLSALTYGIRFGRRGKPTKRHSEMMPQFTAEALVDMPEASNMMMKPPAEPVDVRTWPSRSASVAKLAGKSVRLLPSRK
ncbi:MAG: hypothetical protein ACRYG8_19730 [Janthinobacterium lividum]